MAKQGIVKEDSQPLPFPQELSYLWVWFCELTWSDFSPSQIKSYFELEGIMPKTWELRLIRKLKEEINNI